MNQPRREASTASRRRPGRDPRPLGAGLPEGHRVLGRHGAARGHSRGELVRHQDGTVQRIGVREPIRPRRPRPVEGGWCWKRRDITERKAARTNSACSPP